MATYDIASDHVTNVRVPYGESAIIRLTVRDRQTDQLVDLNATASTMTFSIRLHPQDVTPLVSRVGVNQAQKGIVLFQLQLNDYAQLQQNKQYVCDAWRQYVVGPSTFREQTFPFSPFTPTPSATSSTDASTAPAVPPIVAYGLPSPGSAPDNSVLTNHPVGTLGWTTPPSLPSQTGQSGKFITTDGSTAAWGAIRQLPDPSAQADAKVLKTSGGAAVWATDSGGGGGGVPSLFGTHVGATLRNRPAGTASWQDDPTFNIEDYGGKGDFNHDGTTEPNFALQGTAAFVNGSTAVVGTGSAFTTQLVAGVDYVRLGTDGYTEYALVASIQDATHLTLASGYTGATGSGAYKRRDWVDNSVPFGLAIKAMDRYINLSRQSGTEGAVLEFPPGLYYFSKTIVVTKAIHIRGGGPSSSSYSTTGFIVEQGQSALRVVSPGPSTSAHASRTSNVVTFSLGARIAKASRTFGMTELKCTKNQIGFSNFGILSDLMVKMNGDVDFPDFSPSSPAVVTFFYVADPTYDIIRYAEALGDVAEKDITAGYCRQAVGPYAQPSLTEFLKVGNTFFFITNDAPNFPGGFKIVKSISEFQITYDEVGSNVDQGNVASAVNGYINFGSGAGTIIEDISIKTSGNDATPGIDGVIINAGCELRRVLTSGWTRDGIHLEGGLPFSNVNLVRLYGCSSEANGRHGIFIQGGDSNAILVQACDASFNTGVGIFANAGAGSTIIGCHMRENGIAPIQWGGFGGNPGADNIGIGNYCEGVVQQGSSNTIVLGGPGSEAPEIGSTLGLTYNGRAGFTVQSGRFNSRRIITTYPLVGTTTFNSGSLFVTGSGTHFDTALAVGDSVKFETDKDSAWGEIASIESATHLTLKPKTTYFNSNGTIYTGNFANGSTAVTGNLGAIFTAQILTQFTNPKGHTFVKLATDDDSKYVEVLTVNSDTSLTLASVYAGSTATGLGLIQSHYSGVGGTGPGLSRVKAGWQQDSFSSVATDWKPQDLFTWRAGSSGGDGDIGTETDTDSWIWRYSAPGVGGMFHLPTGWVGWYNERTKVSACGYSTRQDSFIGAGVFAVPQGLIIGSPASSPQCLITNVPFDKTAEPGPPTRARMTHCNRTNTDEDKIGFIYLFKNGSTRVEVLTGDTNFFFSERDQIRLSSDTDGDWASIASVDPTSPEGKAGSFTLTAPYTGSTTAGMPKRRRGYVTMTVPGHDFHLEDARVVVAGDGFATFPFPDGFKLVHFFTDTTVSYYEAGPAADTSGGGRYIARNYEAGSYIINHKLNGATYEDRPLWWVNVQAGAVGLWRPALYLNTNSDDGAGTREKLATTVGTTLVTRQPIMMVNGNNFPNATEHFMIGAYYRIITGAADVNVEVTYADAYGFRTKQIVNVSAGAANSFDDAVAFISASSGADLVASFVVVTTASTSITASGASFNTDLVAGDYVKFATDADEFYAQIFSVDGANALTLTAAYLGAGGTGVLKKRTPIKVKVTSDSDTRVYVSATIKPVS